MRGRKPDPTKWKLIKGNPGKHETKAELEKKLAEEPTPKSIAPQCPVELQGVEREAWEYLVVELGGMGILASSDRAEMTAYCCAWGQWQKAQIKLAEKGEIVTLNGMVQKNPWLAIRNEALRDLSKYGSNLGLSPAQRTRVKANNKKADQPSNPWEALK